MYVQSYVRMYSFFTYLLFFRKQRARGGFLGPSSLEPEAVIVGEVQAYLGPTSIQQRWPFALFFEVLGHYLRYVWGPSIVGLFHIRGPYLFLPCLDGV